METAETGGPVDREGEYQRPQQFGQSHPCQQGQRSAGGDPDGDDLGQLPQDEEDDGEPFEEKMTRLTSELSELFAQSHKLEAEIRQKLEAIGYGI